MNRISFPFINITNNPSAQINETVGAAFRKIVPYLEDLSKLRYYPAPTIITDEKHIKELLPKSDVDALYFEKMELFCQIGLIYHVNRNQKSWFCLPDFGGDEDFVWWAGHISECYREIHHYIQNRKWRHWFASKGQNEQDRTRNVLNAVKFVDLALRETARHSSDSILSSHQEIGWAFKLASKIDQSVIAKLSQQLGVAGQINPSEWQFIRREADGSGGHFRASVEQLSVLFSALAKWIKDLIQNLPPEPVGGDESDWNEQQATNYFVKNARLYGCYSARAGNPSPSLPPEVALLNQQSGVVFVAVTPLLEQAEEVSKLYPKISSHDLFVKMLTSVLLHEHFHAIVNEGIPERLSPANHSAEKAVEESLAEWVELDFFRHDPLMHQWITAHASSGVFPTWPYAGALKIERLAASEKLPRRLALRMIRALRKDSRKAATQFNKL